MKTVTYFIMLLFLIGCAPSLQIVDEGGRQYPNPHYTMKSVNNEISTLFYYTAYSTEQDIDGHIIPIPNYLKIHQSHSFSKRTYHKVTLTVEVRNPKKQTYEIWERAIFQDNGSVDLSQGRRIAYSNRTYRSFIFELPYDNTLYNKLRYGIYMVDANGNIILSFGELRYKIH